MVKKPDYGQQMTDKELKALERRISDVYGTAAKEMQGKIDDYFAKFAKRDAEMKKKLDAGQITDEYYKQWRLAQMGRGQRFEALRDRIADRMTRANETATAYINDATPSLYSLNRNYAAYTIEQVAGDVGFDLWDEQTVKRLIKDQPNLMPFYPPEKAVKRGIDLAFGRQQITAQITSGILQGESIPNLAKRLQQKIPEMNRKSAIRTARTAVTGAQNAGRIDSYKAAQKMGIGLKKQWLATLDGRTRHTHGILDGQTEEVDKPFKVEGYEIMFPGDPKADASMVCNCRCSLVADLDGVEVHRKRRAKDPETGEETIVEDMTYAEWAGWNVEKSGGLTGDTFLAPVGSKDEIEKLKSALTYEQAEALVGQQSKLSYRAYAKEDGMSSWGHAMFADSTDMLSVYGGKDPKWFSVRHDMLTNVEDLKDDIIEARKRTVKNGVGLEGFVDLSDDEFFDMFNPHDIVMSAEAFDDEELVEWIYREVLEPKNIRGIKTYDGALVYDNSIMVRNLPMEVYTKGETNADVVEEMVEQASKTEASAAMKEYLDFKKSIEERYGVDNMWSEMTDDEMESLERLERIAYTGK